MGWVNASSATSIVQGIAYPATGNPSNFLTSVDLSFTNNYSQTNHLHTGVYQPAGTYVTAESDPVWQAQSSTVWGAISGKQATGDYATVTALGGYVSTGAVGTAAYASSNQFATSNQGAKADGALQTSGGTMTGAIDMGTNVVTGSRFGLNAGSEAIGDYWSAVGYNAGRLAIGDYWSAVGYSAGQQSVGDNWSAHGFNAGQLAAHTNSHVIGRYAGYMARGNNRFYLDIYAGNPDYPADGATNDTIFLDSDGKLYLGGGAARAENPSAGGVLRGTWDIGTPNGSGSSLTGITASQVGASPTGHLHDATAITNAPWLTNVTTAAIVAAGAVTNWQYDPVVAPAGSYDLLPYVVSGTVAVSRAMGNSLFLAPTGAATYITADLSTFPTNADALAILTIYYTTQTWGFVGSAITNIGSAATASNYWNFILLKGYGGTKFTAQGQLTQ
jgi:hypothetical protein